MVNARFVTTLQPIADQSTEEAPVSRRLITGQSQTGRQNLTDRRTVENRAATEIILLLFLLYHFFSY